MTFVGNKINMIGTYFKFSDCPKTVLPEDRSYIQPGDLVFRLGSPQIAKILRVPVTHGGIYLGNGVVHDVVGYGQRFIPVEKFVSEPGNNVFRVVRFCGEHSKRIIEKTVENIKNGNYWMPKSTIPWNLVSSSLDYETASCLHYLYYQFLYAIRMISNEKEIAKVYHVEDVIRHIIPYKEFEVRYYCVYLAKWHMMRGNANSLIFKNRWENIDRSWNIFRKITIKAYSYSSFIESRYFELVGVHD